MYIDWEFVLKITGLWLATLAVIAGAVLGFLLFPTVTLWIIGIATLSLVFFMITTVFASMI